MRLLLSFLAIAFGVSSAYSQVNSAGHWEGEVKATKGPSRLSLDLDRDAQGAWIASLGVPERKVSGLMVVQLSVTDTKVKFTSPDLPGSPVFDLTLGEGKLKGTMAYREKSMPMEMTRTGDAKVEVVKPDPAVSPELEGDWVGALILPGDERRPLTFHFRNRPDHLLFATLDSPSQGALGLSLYKVVEKGREVEFFVRIHGGHFKGTLDPGNNLLTGEWVQNPGDAPLPCKMRKN